MSNTEKVIINAAVTGCVLTRNDNPNLPVTPAEIAAEGRRLRDAGAAILHVHARKPDGTPASGAAAYVEVVELVRRACPDLICCVSLTGRFDQDIARRAEALCAKPEMASLSLGSMNFPGGPSVNSPEAIRELARLIYESGAVPEFEVFEAGFINYANYLIQRKELRPPYYFNLIFGSLGAAPLDLLGMGHMVALLPPGAIWAAGGIGRYQLDANLMALAAGGHVRVGLEDNPCMDRARKVPADNVRLVERIVRIARDIGREPASPDEARAIIGLPSRSGYKTTPGST